MRYFMELQYEGAAYFGWQRQKGQVSVQQTIEQALTTLLRREIEITGAGRTDTGVSACYYVAHFDVEERLEDPGQVVYKLNRILPRDIAVHTLTEVSEEAHARFSAVERSIATTSNSAKTPSRSGRRGSMPYSSMSRR